MLATALEMEGHLVDEAASATEGLQCLQQSRYDLVLSDYAMPGGTGTWMLRQATEQGLLDNTISLIVTAHPDVRDFNVEVISKPLDMEKFLAQIRHILASASSGSQPRVVTVRDDEGRGAEAAPADQSPPDPLN